MLQLFITPPYSRDLSPPDYFLFPKLKMKLKGLHFATVAEIQEAVTDELKKVQKEEFSAASQKLYDHTKACICASGAYFELKKGTCLPHMSLIFKKTVQNVWTILCMCDITGVAVFCILILVGVVSPLYTPCKNRFDSIGTAYLLIQQRILKLWKLCPFFLSFLVSGYHSFTSLIQYW